MSVMEMDAQWRTASAKLRHLLLDFCAREWAGSTASRGNPLAVSEADQTRGGFSGGDRFDGAMVASSVK
jgi:hypothetical protein